MFTAARFVLFWWPSVALAACSGPGADRPTQNRGAEVEHGTPAVVTGGARVACDTAPHDPARYLTLNPGRLRLEASTEWRMSENGATEIAFSVPAVSDPQGGARTEVYVGILGPGPVRDLAAATDSVLARLTAGSLRAVLADTMPDANHRYFWWNGEHDGTSYSIFNDFGQAGGAVVHVLISMALLEDTPQAAHEAFARDTGHLLSTLSVDGQRVFPGWTMHPTVECYAPADTVP
jgi:hypothetical protein